MLKRCAIAALKGYQAYGRHLFPCSCRFVPSCSDYAVMAIDRYGFLRGGIKAAWRILRCHPLSGRSGYDPLV
jgi:uncharacterized protein